MPHVALRQVDTCPWQSPPPEAAHPPPDCFREPMKQPRLTELTIPINLKLPQVDFHLLKPLGESTHIFPVVINSLQIEQWDIKHVLKQMAACPFVDESPVERPPAYICQSLPFSRATAQNNTSPCWNLECTSRSTCERPTHKKVNSNRRFFGPESGRSTLYELSVRKPQTSVAVESPPS